jgi:uncharacterized sulfatase
MNSSALINYAVFTLASSFILPSCRDVAKTDSRNPNIIFILADDMGYGDPGCYNQEIIPVISAKILL